MSSGESLAGDRSTRPGGTSASGQPFDSPERPLAQDGRPAASAAPLLSVEGLTTGFDLKGRFVPAVIDVSFDISPGETLGLVGESGSGKSLTALSIMRLVQPPGRITAGRLIFKGRDLRELSVREMQAVRGADIALIFQEPMTALNPVFTIGSQIEETLRVHGRATRATARQKAIDLLEAVSIPDPHKRVRDYPHQLSGGLRQRALIAISLACNPSLVIADEPTTALDVTIQAQILELLRDLQQRMGLALLLITHDLGIVAEMADRVAVMYAGRIVEEAPVMGLFDDPRHPYTRGLMASMPGGEPGTRLRAIQGTVPPLGELPPGCAFAPRCPDRFEPCARLPPGTTVIALRTPLAADRGPLSADRSPLTGHHLPPASQRTASEQPPETRSQRPAASDERPTPDGPRPAASGQRFVKCYLYGPAVNSDVRDEERA
jgi:peptide/nickel transport system ATP-binding protein